MNWFNKHMDEIFEDGAESPFVVEGGITRLTRLKDGRVMCTICMEYTERKDLEPVSDEPGRVWDVCTGCAVFEKANGATHY